MIKFSFYSALICTILSLLAGAYIAAMLFGILTAMIALHGSIMKDRLKYHLTMTDVLKRGEEMCERYELGGKK